MRTDCWERTGVASRDKVDSVRDGDHVVINGLYIQDSHVRT